MNPALPVTKNFMRAVSILRRGADRPGRAWRRALADAGGCGSA
jgi:hypothetical protein